jgi:hypothetical protein
MRQFHKVPGPEESVTAGDTIAVVAGPIVLSQTKPETESRLPAGRSSRSY